MHRQVYITSLFPYLLIAVTAGDFLSSNSTTSDYRNNWQTDPRSRWAVPTPGLSIILGSPPLSDRSLDRTRDVDFSMSTDGELSLPASTFSFSRCTRRFHKPLNI